MSEVILTKDIPDAVLKDETIEQTYKDEKGKEQTLTLWSIAWCYAKSNRVYEFITNNFDIKASTVTQLYQYRYKIELFFKKIKYPPRRTAIILFRE